MVADFERIPGPAFHELFDLVDHLIVSQHFARLLTSEEDPRLAVRKIWNKSRQLVAVTCGSEGCWYLSKPDPETLNHQPAFPVETVDTTGCGDVFHGAYAAFLARGMSLPECIRLASGAAALKATQKGGQNGSPTLEALLRFMEERPAALTNQ